MSVAHWIAGALLAAGLAVELLGCLGLLVNVATYDRLHLVAPAVSVGPTLICAAVVVDEGIHLASAYAVIIAALLLVTGPVLTHATGRCARLRETRGLEVLPSELRAAGRT